MEKLICNEKKTSYSRLPATTHPNRFRYLEKKERKSSSERINQVFEINAALLLRRK